MMLYYVLRDVNTGLYWRGKGENRWGKYFNQVSIYRSRGQAENTVKDLMHRGIKVEIMPVRVMIDKTVKMDLKGDDEG